MAQQLKVSLLPLHYDFCFPLPWEATAFLHPLLFSPFFSSEHFSTLSLHLQHWEVTSPSPILVSPFLATATAWLTCMQAIGDGPMLSCCN